jgi:small-conductance mechanosensitive channel
VGLKIVLDQANALLPKAAIATNVSPNALATLCAGLLAVLIAVILRRAYSDRYKPPRVLACGIGLVTLFCGELYVFNSPWVDQFHSAWLVSLKYLVNLGYYLLIAAIVADLVLYIINRASRSSDGMRLIMVRSLQLLIYLFAIGLYYSVELGRDILPLLATSSVVLTVIGLALRDMIMDFISGITMIFDDSIKVGHWVNFQWRDRRVDGRIEELNWRYVRLVSRDDIVHLVPNSSVYAQIVSNLSLVGGYRRIDVSFSADPDVSVGTICERVATAVRAALPSLSGVNLEKPLRVVCEQILPQASQMKVQFFLKDSVSVDNCKSVLLGVIHAELETLNALPGKNFLKAGGISINRKAKSKDEPLEFSREILG